MSEIIQIPHQIPHNMEMCGFFFKVLLTLKKMAATDQLTFFCVCKNSKIELRNNSHFTITLPPPSGIVQVILLKFKMASTSRLFKYL